jgi:cell fate regulator YaaT (PSP1 superfamily)
MAKAIGVKFRSRGRVVSCDAHDLALQVSNYVVVDTDHGPAVAKVTTLEASARPGEQLLMIVRLAEPDDLELASLKLREEAMSTCAEMATELGLDMKPLLARHDLESERLTVFFSAPERIDFRDLVRKLNHALQMRVELRQAGARDEAKLLGSAGRCGYPLCCRTFLPGFASVSIKMAKEQSLALNPMKISGICGRLLCCLSYESKEYAAVKKRMPRLKQEILTPRGKATVISTNLLKETVTVLLENQTVTEMPLDELVQGG